MLWGAIKTDYHCHGSPSANSQALKKPNFKNEASFKTKALALLLGGQTEVSLSYKYGRSGNTPQIALLIDILTDEYVIEEDWIKGVA